MYFKDISTDEFESFEKGKLPLDNQITLFQKIIDSGMLWTMKNDYILKANNLIDDGYVIQRNK
jgi:hypothetical protein|tara:strand:- start:1024 stop:1212 length:189 start_codon:yes stop_codon:yes gene_type:complete